MSYEHSSLTSFTLYMTKVPSHNFFTSKQCVHSWFMDLDNSFEVVVQYLLIEGIISLSHRIVRIKLLKA